jgi:hypothetical protein
MKGIKGFEEQMKVIVDKIEDEVNGSVSFEALFDLGFMDKNSDFGTFNELLDHYGFEVNNQEDFEALNEEKLDDAIRKSTCFSSWNEMYEVAATEYVYRKLTNAGFDIET